MNAVRILAFVSCCAAVAASAPGATAAPASGLQARVKTILTEYLAKRGKAEHISAVSFSVSLANRSFVDVAAGTTSYGGSTPVTPAWLYQIGSNTKAFAAVVMERLQTQRKVSTDQPLSRWLPGYARWKNVTIAQMLDMTSGIESYDNTPAWENAIAAQPARNLTPQQLIAFVAKAPMQSGWHYSNTGYLLNQLIAEKASGQSYATLLGQEFARAHLTSTYYADTIYPSDIRARTVAGYYDNAQAGGGLARILGRNVRDDSVSWMQAAGGIIATPHDLVLWARQLYQGSLLTAEQRAQIETLVSCETGKPVTGATPGDPKTFGLGVAQMYQPGIGTFWFYEGMTLGYRVAHAYFPKRDIVFAVGLNSQPSAKEDRIGALVSDLYKAILAGDGQGNSAHHQRGRQHHEK